MNLPLRPRVAYSPPTKISIAENRRSHRVGELLHDLPQDILLEGEVVALDHANRLRLGLLLIRLLLLLRFLLLLWRSLLRRRRFALRRCSLGGTRGWRRIFRRAIHAASIGLGTIIRCRLIFRRAI